jgi:TolA-binding protein
MQISRDGFKERNEASERDLNSLRNHVRNMNEKIKDLTDKSQKYKDDATKSKNLLIHKQTQFQHESRKREIEVNKLKDKVNSVWREKAKDIGVYFDSRIQVTTLEAFENKELDGSLEVYKERCENLLEENAMFRECIRILYQAAMNLYRVDEDDEETFIQVKESGDCNPS